MRTRGFHHWQNHAIFFGVNLREFQRRLIKWFQKNRRDLPWRKKNDPYAIWVSEVMLQQTRVETVIPYYERFMKEFPTVEHLARAPLSQVLKAWEGLGYYARARHLHTSARRIWKNYGGGFPEDFDAFQSLPGVGRSTAGAVFSMAFQKPYPVLDGNVKRVLIRLWAFSQPASKIQKTLFEIASGLLPQKNPGAFNQAMIELGATICTPRNPLCLSCPVEPFCRARAEGLENSLPLKLRTKVLPHYDVSAGVIWKKGRVLIARRPLNGLLGGLWEFPGGKKEPGESMEVCLQREIQEELGIQIAVRKPLFTIPHTYSHFRITLHVYHCDFLSGNPKALGCMDFKWVHPSALSRYAFPAANHPIIEALNTIQPRASKSLDFTKV